MSKGGSARFHRLARYVVAVGILLLVLCLILIFGSACQPGQTRGEVPKAQPTASPLQPATPTPPTAAASAADEQRALDFLDAAIGDVVGPPTASELMEKWIATKQEVVGEMVGETFEQSLGKMLDWQTYCAAGMFPELYFSGLPCFPATLKSIIYSRGFAKLMEETEAGPSEQQITAIASCLRGDLATWREHWDPEDEDLFLPPLVWGPNPEEKLEPVSHRINAMVLLIGERSIRECLPLIVETFDTQGQYVNYSAVGYACDKILRSVDQSTLNREQKAILDEYFAWKAQMVGHGYPEFEEYQVLELPTFRSARRPHEPATTFGPVDFSEGRLTVEVPPQYRGRVVLDRNDPSKVSYEHMDTRVPSLCRVMIKDARRFLEAGQ